jgi:hypothetical protein
MTQSALKLLLSNDFITRLGDNDFYGLSDGELFSRGERDCHDDAQL